jgi:hypothetical protein
MQAKHIAAVALCLFVAALIFLLGRQSPADSPAESAPALGAAAAPIAAPVAPKTVQGAAPEAVENKNLQAQELPAARVRLNKGRSRRADRNGWRNVGTSTIQNAMETFFWALKEGDEKVIAGMLDFDDGAKEYIKSMYDKLPEGDKAVFENPETYYASMLRGAAVGLPSAGAIQSYHPIIQNNRKKGGTEVVVAIVGEDGAESRKKIVFYRHSDGWRFAAITKDAVAEQFEGK